MTHQQQAHQSIQPQHQPQQAVGAAAGAISGGGSEQQGAYQQEPQQGAYAAQQPMGANACQIDAQNFQACLSHNAGNVNACNFLYEALQQCQRNSQFASNQM